MPRVRLVWNRGGHAFEAIEPDVHLLERHADRLRDWYNAPENASMMDGSGTMSREDVLDFWRDLRDSGGPRARNRSTPWPTGRWLSNVRSLAR